MKHDRRELLKLAALFAASVATMRGFAMDPGPQKDAAHVESEAGGRARDFNIHAVAGSSNFKAIYDDPKLKAAFLQFLTNVYHLFPENRLHNLIASATS